MPTAHVHRLLFRLVLFALLKSVCFSFCNIFGVWIERKMSNFRLAGLNYVQYSNIAARMLRRALKAEKRAEAAKREESHVRITPWKDGKPATAGESKAKA